MKGNYWINRNIKRLTTYEVELFGVLPRFEVKINSFSPYYGLSLWSQDQQFCQYVAKAPKAPSDLKVGLAIVYDGNLVEQSFFKNVVFRSSGFQGDPRTGVFVSGSISLYSPSIAQLKSKYIRT